MCLNFQRKTLGKGFYAPKCLTETNDSVNYFFFAYSYDIPPCNIKHFRREWLVMLCA